MYIILLLEASSFLIYCTKDFKYVSLFPVFCTLNNLGKYIYVVFALSQQKTNDNGPKQTPTLMED